MLTRKILPTLVALSLGMSGVAFGQGDDRPQDRRPYTDVSQQGQHSQQAQHDQQGQRDQHDQSRADHGYRGHEGRGAGPDHAFYRGDRLPNEYRGRQYVVNDWRSHRLSAPPRGYQWMQSGGDYVLVAIATGIIASILLNQ